MSLEEENAGGEGPFEMRQYQELAWELDAIIDSSSDGLFVCDAEANVIRMNPASEIVGRNMRDLIAEGFIDRSAALESYNFV